MDTIKIRIKNKKYHRLGSLPDVFELKVGDIIENSGTIVFTSQSNKGLDIFDAILYGGGRLEFIYKPNKNYRNITLWADEYEVINKSFSVSIDDTYPAEKQDNKTYEFLTIQEALRFDYPNEKSAYIITEYGGIDPDCEKATREIIAQARLSLLALKDKDLQSFIYN